MTTSKLSVTIVDLYLKDLRNKTLPFAISQNFDEFLLYILFSTAEDIATFSDANPILAETSWLTHNTVVGDFSKFIVRVKVHLLIHWSGDEYKVISSRNILDSGGIFINSKSPKVFLVRR